MLVGVGNAWGDEETITFSDKGYSNGEAVASVSGTAFTIAFDKGTNSNAPKYYTTGSAIRAYGGNTFTVSSEYTITEIFLTFATGEGTNAITTDVGTFSTDKWTGSDNTVVFTIGGTSGHRRIASIKVTYTTGGTQTETCVTPTFSPAAGVYTSAQNVTLNTTTDGATIYYTTDGSTPTTSSTQYNGAISVSTTTTIKAIAVKDDYNNSSVATATYLILGHAGTAEDPYTVADARAAIDAGVGVTNVYVTGIVTEIPTAYSTQYSNITFNFVDEGGSDFLQAYRCTGTDAANVQVGDIVVVSGNLTKYNSTYEFASGCTLVSLIHNAAVEAPTFTPAAGTYTSAQSVTISTETSDATIYYTTDGTEPTVESTEYTGAISVSTTTTIKAIAVKGSDESNVTTASYYFCSAESPYTVTQALAFNEYPANEIYVTGIVSTAPTQTPTSNGELTYYISVDGEATNQLEVYKGKGLEQAAFTAQDDIQVGDIVTIFGNVVIYGTSNPIKEFATGNYLVAFERPVSTDPVINAEDVTLAYDATSGEIAYSIENPVTGVALEATTAAEWISNIVVDAAAITFTTTANEGDADRMATITLTYGDVTKEVTVTQEHFEEVLDYAVLPFEWEGGVKADFLALNGVSADGLGSDYAESHEAYRMKFDNTDDYILVKTDSRPGVVTIGVKMIGGANTSSITVQGSADGETFTDVETLTISGTQSATLTLVTTKDFAENDRYVKLVFTKGSNVGVGPISIAKYSNKQDATITFKKDGEVISTLEVNLNDMVEVAAECNVEGAEITYTSSNPKIATYEDGTILAFAEGEATITATFVGNDDYKAATATLAVTVVDNRQDVTLAFNDIPAEININETATYAVTATPAVEGITYSSSAPAVVSVDENTGEIEALAVGTATITATFAGNNSYKAAEASYTIKVVDPDFVASKYELVTDATTLKAGDEIIIVDYEASGATYAISTNQKSSNREATSVTVADGTITPSADVAIITLGGETNAWTFYVTNGAAQGYLYASSSSQNQLKTEAEVDENGNANAKIEIANGAATVTFQGNYTRNIMQYNYNNGSPLFACYNAIADTRSLVSIYRKVASSETVPGDVNKDGVPTIADVTALVNIILGKATPEANPEYDFKAANVNGDDDITIADVTALVNIILGKE